MTTTEENVIAGTPAVMLRINGNAICSGVEKGVGVDGDFDCDYVVVGRIEAP